MSHRNHIRRTYPIAVGGDADSKVWFPNWFLIWSIKKTGANCWANGKGGTSGSQEEKADARKKRDFSAMLWRKKKKTTIM